MSDCQSWFGSARSKRRSGCARAGVAAGASGISPSSCSTRRTVVSDTPSPAKRASTSRIRRVPHSGCACRVSTTWTRRASFCFASARATAFAAAPVSFGFSASTPPWRYSPMYFCTAPNDTPNATATSR